jgi:hypothetical protein
MGVICVQFALAVTFLAFVRYGIMTALCMIFYDGQFLSARHLRAALLQSDNLLQVTDQESGKRRLGPS